MYLTHQHHLFSSLFPDIYLHEYAKWMGANCAYFIKLAHKGHSIPISGQCNGGDNVNFAIKALKHDLKYNN